jgi:hypothetical protein
MGLLGQVPFPVLEPYARRALQMHSSLVQRLVCQRVMEVSACMCGMCVCMHSASHRTLSQITRLVLAVFVQKLLIQFCRVREDPTAVTNSSLNVVCGF